MRVRRAGSATVATRRPLVPRPVIVVAALAIGVVAYLGIVAAGQTGPDVLAAETLPQTVALDTRREVASVDRSARSAAAGTFAEIDGLPLVLPHPRPVAVAFHEASQAEALALQPVGSLEANDNTARFTAPADEPGPAYRILPSRGRGRPATSAVDVVVPNGELATAPVTGTVVEVREYALYGGLDDWRVVVQPDLRPDLHVVLIHLHAPHVEVGDVVVAGQSKIGLPRLLSFTSHVDYVLDDEHPHVHMEVKAAGQAAPLDPNVRAVEPSEANS